jgi:DNA-binding beta-propeller fold protein YncE
LYGVAFDWANDGAHIWVADGPAGVLFDGANIWVANRGEGTVAKLRASDGALEAVYPIAGYGVAFDGVNLWVAAHNLIEVLDGANIWVAGGPIIHKVRVS